MGVLFVTAVQNAGKWLDGRGNKAYTIIFAKYATLIKKNNSYKTHKTMKAFIARDKGGPLSIYFGKKPYKGEYAWSFYDHLSMNFADIPDKNLFPEVKWEDETPTEVEIKIVDSSQKQTKTKFDKKH